MELISIQKDKQNRPVAQLSFSNEEVDYIKKAAKNHPKYDDPDSEGMRIRGLVERDYTKPVPNITIKDMREVINKGNQDHPEAAMPVLYDQLHQVWKSLNPS